MNDSERVRLCAEAMGYTPFPKGSVGEATGWYIKYDGGQLRFDPFHDDAQIMALIKKLRIDVIFDNGVTAYEHNGSEQAWSQTGDVNEAVIACAAKMWEAKRK